MSGPQRVEEQEREDASRTLSSGVPDAKDGACGVCNDKTAKYKCSKCSLRFCSVPCGKLHKATHSDSDQPAASPAASPTVVAETGPPQKQAPENRFSVLERDRRLAELFIKYPDLEDQLAAIDRVARPLPDDKIRLGWNADAGQKKALEVLRVAKGMHPGVEEFAELVTHLLSNADQDRAVEGRPMAIHQDEEEIRRLMALEAQGHEAG